MTSAEREKIVHQGDVIGGDKVAGDMIVGDKVLGDKSEIHQHYHQPSTTPLDQQQRRNRRAMIEQVKAIWVTGLLEQSLAEVVRIDLELVDTPDAVELALDLQYQELHRQPRSIPIGTPIIDVFMYMNRSMLILGAPGAGKTTLLLELARDLILCAERDESFPIPVVFNLSSWAARHLPLKRWLVDELNTKYTVPHRIAQQWVQDNAILPLFDGLDEVAEDMRAACVQALHTFRREESGLGPIAVCSRLAEYEMLPERLALHSAVLVQPLTPQQIALYLADVDEPLTALRSALEEDRGLQDLASSPLMLGLMVVTYQHSLPNVASDRGTFEEQRRQLLAAYIERLFQRRGNNSQYARQQTIRWLRWLARAMDKQGQTVFFIEQMQPSWLPVKQQQRYAISEGILSAVAAGIGAGVFFGTSAGIANAPVAEWISVLINGSLAVGAATESGVRPLLFMLLGVLVGLVAGVVGGLFYWAIAHRNTGQSIRGDHHTLGSWSFVSTVFFVSVAYGLTTGMVAGAFFGWLTMLRWWVGAGPIGGLVVAYALKPGEIASIEYVRWNWSKAVRGGLIGGVIGIVVSVAVWRIDDITSWLLLIPTIAIVACGLVFGLTGGAIDTRNIPNQGIRRSARMALWVGVAACLLGGLSISAVGGLPDMQLESLVGRGWLGVAFGIAAGLFFGLIYGGAACLQHYLLRLILSRNGYLPLRLVPFLDYCVERIFLRRVGGGYIFVHRLLMEHFASLHEEPAD